MNGHKYLIYELNTRVWLNTLSRRAGKPITLANIPDPVIDHLAKLRVSAVWPMGVWTRSRGGRAGAGNVLNSAQSAQVL